MRIKLKDLKPYHIEGFYRTLYERGLSGNSVLHYHILIRECLQYAFKNDFVNFNVADKVDRPKTEGYKASFYSIEEIEKLFDCIKDNECKLPIMLTAMYGFRRSEVLGLKWEAIDFENKLVYVKHKIVETRLDGKRYIQMSDKMKTKTSKRNQLRHIRFHDLRHSCASIMLKNGVPMKQIQEWLGHADFGTTANIYSHLDYSAKQSSANTISNVFNFVEQKSIQSKIYEEQLAKEKDKTEELEEKLARLEEQLRQQQEDEEYQEWLKEKEERKKRKRQSDMEM